MFNLLLALILIVLISFIVIQSVTVRITYANEPIIDIDFTLFALVLYPARTKNQSKHNKSKYHRIKNNFIKAAAVKRGLEFLFKRSHITVHDINVPERSSDPAKIAVRSQSISSIILIFLTYLSLKSESLTSEDKSFVYLRKEGDHHRTYIDLSLSSTLCNVVITFLIIFLEVRKLKRRQVRKFVRN